jgi:hypothetical protein
MVKITKESRGKMIAFNVPVPVFIDFIGTCTRGSVADPNPNFFYVSKSE